MKNLTSVDVANLLRNYALKEHFVNLNKTQVNKLLFMCYGFYLASTGKKLFLETPKAWPYGPVFPNVYKSYYLFSVPIYIEDEKQMEFDSDMKAKIFASKLLTSFAELAPTT